MGRVYVNIIRKNVQQDIAKLMSLAANAVNELCKPTPSTETVEYTTKDFVKTLDVSCI